jgi:hypothetical protein
MVELQRITTEYVDVQDRIRVAGEVAGVDVPVVLWLMVRLLDRLVPVLLQRLAGQGADTPYKEILHSFAQQTARSELKPELAVQAGEGSAAWLVLSVDIAQSAAGATSLEFKGEGGQQATLILPAKALRQWLGIVHDACCQAN